MPASNIATIQTRTIKWLYILALSMVAILTMTGQVLVQWSLATLQGDSTTVNIAGRQRMLSQRIPRIILALDANRGTFKNDTPPQLADESSTYQRSTAGLQESLNVWRANHLGLVNASRTVGLSRANSQPINDLFAKIEHDFVRVEEIVKSVIARMDDPNSVWARDDERTELLKHSDSFLSLMDTIVAQYEFEARQRVSRLQWIERGLLIATLLVLICEGLFIFSPAIASLDRAFGRLEAVTNQLELAKESAEQANNAKTQFLARVSHELRTPLHAILGMLGLLRHGRLTDGQKQRADLAYNASRTLRHLVDDLLDVSSAESGAPLTLHLERTNVGKLTSDCVKLMNGHARRKRLKLHAVTELPDGAFFQLDEYRVRQILINLIQNAIRYTQTGEIECRTWIEANAGSEGEVAFVWLNVSVRDTGCGIAPENLDRIFENFVRINPHDGPQVIGPRLGLGLPITASLVATMQGTLTVESKLDEGSVFSIRLPTNLVKGDDSASQPQGPVNRQSTLSKLLRDDELNKSLTALIVDDSKVNRLLLRNYLNRLGIKACSTNNLVRALTLYEEILPKLVLLDLHVGKQKSLGLISTIRSLPGGSQSLIYIITADSHFSSTNCPVELNVAAVLNKPIEFEELSTHLKPLLQLPDRPQLSFSTEPISEFDELRTELRRMLTEQLPAEIERLNNAFASQDFKAVELIAHRLRGSAANAVWTELADASAKIEANPASFDEQTFYLFISKVSG